MNKAFKLKTIEDFNSVDVFDTITLTYDNRYRRRILMKSDHGLEFLLDLAKTTELRSGNFIELEPSPSSLTAVIKNIRQHLT